MAASTLLVVPNDPSSSSASSRRTSLAGKILIRRKSSRRTPVAAARRKSTKVAKDKTSLARNPSRTNRNNNPSLRSFSLDPSSAQNADQSADEPSAAPPVYNPRSSSISPSVSPARRKLAYHHPALKRTDSFSSVWSDVSDTEDPYAVHVEDDEDDAAVTVGPLDFDGNNSDDQYDAEYDAVEVYVHENSDDDEEAQDKYEERDFMERDNYYDSADDRRYQSSALLRLKRGETELKPRRSIMLLDGLLHDVEAFTADENYAPTLKSIRRRTPTVVRKEPKPPVEADPPASAIAPQIVVDTPPAIAPTIVVDTPSPPPATPIVASPAPTPTPATSEAIPATPIPAAAITTVPADPPQATQQQEQSDDEPTTPPANVTLTAPSPSTNSNSDSAYSSLERRKNSGGAPTTPPAEDAARTIAANIQPKIVTAISTPAPSSPRSTSTTLVDEQATPLVTTVTPSAKTAATPVAKPASSQKSAVAAPAAPASQRTYRAPDAQPKGASSKRNSTLPQEPKKKGFKRFFRRLSKALHV
ncbi:hypothetical protein HDU87_008689 [Geranomyces variabilis]|uniref:Uncharacterized protein n=1 Tax=Geranomyces variabilis TaxID=109894 RepID=A0AAD5TCS2_9FUNG|nr:hypothetical protein HDU87_008689 [Geranomyces variabilis]